MNRLSTELQRLYFPPTPNQHEADPAGALPELTTTDDRVRVMVIGLQRPAGWNATSLLWQGVQDEIGLPAPAIAVDGHDGYQLWFSLMQATSVAQAHEFLERLCQRFLGEIDQHLVRLLPAADSTIPGTGPHARVPPFQFTGSHRWSAFVTPDLAGLFADEPWLDLQPGSDAQADLLARLRSITPEEFRLALARMGAAPDKEAVMTPAATLTSGGTAPATNAAPYPDPKQFLLAVMNDPNVAMSLRIDAAKALLPAWDK